VETHQRPLRDKSLERRQQQTTETTKDAPSPGSQEVGRGGRRAGFLQQSARSWLGISRRGGGLVCSCGGVSSALYIVQRRGVFSNFCLVGDESGGETGGWLRRSKGRQRGRRLLVVLAGEDHVEERGVVGVFVPDATTMPRRTQEEDSKGVVGGGSATAEQQQSSGRSGASRKKEKRHRPPDGEEEEVKEKRTERRRRRRRVKDATQTTTRPRARTKENEGARETSFVGGRSTPQCDEEPTELS